MYQNERYNEIRAILEQIGYVTVDYLAKKMHVSPSSIRRDLTNMEQKGEVKRSYGGVELADGTFKNTPFDFRSHENADKKRIIADLAVKMISDGDVIYVDGSSTASFLFKALPSVRDITVITNSVDGLYYLSKYQVNTISTGGLISTDDRSVLVGDSVCRSLKDFNVKLAFFSALSVDFTGNITDCHYHEVPLYRQVLESSCRAVFLCDSTKLGKTSPYRIGSLKEVDTFVCDSDTAERYKAEFPSLHILYPK